LCPRILPAEGRIFEAVAAPSGAARQKTDALEAQLAGACAERERADEAFDARAKQAVAGVLADPTGGDEGALYGAFGYTHASERKTGHTRKRTQPPTT
jgi:hypothetical protein